MTQIIVITGASSGFGVLAAHALAKSGADASEVAEAIARVVDMPFGKRPFRVHIDPSQDGAEIVNGVADRVRAELLRRIGLADLLHPAA
jgi:NAD(P)-dependent dehydrogenase (short-subunit alcohol dehydrogenase family)